MTVLLQLITEAHNDCTVVAYTEAHNDCTVVANSPHLQLLIYVHCHFDTTFIGIYLQLNEDILYKN